MPASGERRTDAAELLRCNAKVIRRTRRNRELYMFAIGNFISRPCFAY